MDSLENIVNKISLFRDKRDWKKYHNPKDMSLSLVLEATELLEHFQWKDEKEMNKYVITNKNEIAEELADVFYWLILISHDLNINLIESINDKMIKNEQKYPIEKAKGNNKKYNKL